LAKKIGPSKRAGGTPSRRKQSGEKQGKLNHRIRGELGAEQKATEITEKAEEQLGEDKGNLAADFARGTKDGETES
jgi:hypothetical protein